MRIFVQTRQVMTKQDLNILAKENEFDLINKEWMLVTAGTKDGYNTMTASWGGLGWLWYKPVAFIFVRPERYTHDFLENGDRVTLSFYGDGCREALQLCGSKSGRDMDKVAASGLVPVEMESGSISFDQARMTLDCRKLFRSDMVPENFTDKATLERWYNDKPGGGFHTIYILEIENVYTK